MRSGRAFSAAVALLAAVAAPGLAAAEETLAAKPPVARAGSRPPERTLPVPTPTPLWVVGQLVPSPELAFFQAHTHAGLRWQLTPFLLSFGMNRRVFPLRSLVVEPLVRYAGSVALEVSPEYLDLGAQGGATGTIRGGVRTYLPLLERGEQLAFSFGASAYSLVGHGAVAYELGLHGMSGVFGLVVGQSLTAAVPLTTVTLAIRFF